MEEKKSKTPANQGKKQKKVGYKNPPQETRWKPGQSGNPLGRPKGSKNWDTIFELALKKIVKEKRLPVKDPEVEMVIKAIVKALKGNYNFFKDLMDRRYGKPKEPIEIGGGELPVKIVVEKMEENGRGNN